MAFIVNTPLGFQPTHRATNLSQAEQERKKEDEATDTEGSSSFWTPKAQRPPSPDQNTQPPIDVAGSGWLTDSAMHPGLPRPQYRKQEDERKGETTKYKNNACGGSFEDSPLIANVKPHESYKIHVATKSQRIHKTPGIVRRVVTEVARLYYATGERPGFSMQGLRGKGGWDEFSVAIGPLKDSPLAFAMYRVDKFMKAFIDGGRYFPRSGSSLEETRRLARQAKNLEAQRKKEGTDLYDWVKEWSDIIVTIFRTTTSSEISICNTIRQKIQVAAIVSVPTSSHAQCRRMERRSSSSQTFT